MKGKILYKDFLKSRTECPFCGDQQRKIAENGSAYITYSLAPYHKHHLLVIPHKHTESLLKITDEEMRDIDKLQKLALNILYKLGYDNASFLVREGNSRDRSISHIHFHVIPDINIGDVDHDGNKRTILTDEEIDGVMKDFKSALDQVTPS